MAKRVRNEKITGLIEKWNDRAGLVRGQNAVKAVCILLAVLLTAGLCSFLYFFDNRYSTDGDQPICGTFFYDEEDNEDICWLYREWEFYPGVSTGKKGALPELSGAYRKYTDLGGSDSMEHGSAVYRMTLVLPEEECQYAFEMPEIYSAYIMYIDGNPVLQIGDPSESDFEGKTQTRTVYFEASGNVEITVAVRDQSWIYSGMTHVPAFGRAEAISRMHDMRILVHGAGLVFSLAGIVMAGIFLLRGSRRRGAWYMASFVSLLILTGYPVFHSFFQASLQPWYTIEVTGYYVLILSVISIELDSFREEKIFRLYALIPCWLGVIAALARSAAAAWWTGEAGQIFSDAVQVLKLYAALCLILMSLRLASGISARSILMLATSSAFACCLAADRLLPLFEPILTGWFEEIGGCILGIMAGVFMWTDAAQAYRFRLTYKEHLRYMEQKLAMQKDHYRELSAQVKRSREASHDMRHHVRVLRAMADQGQLDKVSAYLERYEPHLVETHVLVWSDHPAADAVLNHYWGQAKKLQAEYDVRLAIPPDLDFPEDELCVILSNLLENAVHALEKEPVQGRRIFLRGSLQQNRLLLAVDNTFTGSVKIVRGVYMSTSHEGPGVGTGSVKALAEKHGGIADFSDGEGVFRVNIMIPLNTEQK